MSFFNEGIVEGFEEDCLEQMESLRINIDTECEKVLKDKYERANKMLDDCIKIVKKVGLKYW